MAFGARREVGAGTDFLFPSCDRVASPEFLCTGRSEQVGAEDCRGLVRYVFRMWVRILDQAGGVSLWNRWTSLACTAQ
jgi:hypothetical protein